MKIPDSFSNSFRTFVLSVGAALLLALAPQTRAQLVADGEFLTLNNVATNISGGVTIGANGSFTVLILTNSATLTNTTDGIIGFNAGANSNSVSLHGVNSRWDIGNTLRVGAYGSGNQLVICGGATLTDSGGIVGNETGGNNNMALVTGAGTLWNNNRDSLFVGGNSSGNQLVVSNGGSVVSVAGYVGAFNNNNTALITGTDSLWMNRTVLYVGYFGSGNQLVVRNGGVVVANGVILSFDSNSTNNRVTVDGGTLLSTNILGSASLAIRRGTNVFNSGLIEGSLVMNTGSSGQFEFNGGTLNTGKATVSNGTLFTVGNGSSAATYRMSGVTTNVHSFANGLRISTNAILTGNGTIGGVLTVASGGSFVPGTSVGKIILSNSPSLSGGIVMEIGKAVSTLTNDQVQVLAPLTYGGSLTVSNIGPDLLVAGNGFPLFSANTYSGAFTSLVLPELSPGLSWTNQLLVNGSIAVVNKTAPSFGVITQSGTNLVFNVTGGSPGGAYDLLTATNISLDLSNWTLLDSGNFSWLGNVTLTNGINPAEVQRYFSVRVP